MTQPTRRDFLKILLSSAAAEAIDFEKLLWTPKTIVSVPALPVGIPYHNNVVFTYRWYYKPHPKQIEFYNEQIKIQDTIFPRY